MPTPRRRLRPWHARLVVAVAAAKAWLLLAAGAALASTTSTTLPRPGAGARRINLPFLIVAVGGAVLIVVMQRRASRKLRDMFPSDPNEGDGRPDGPDGRQAP
jgi:hypothetical protein